MISRIPVRASVGLSFVESRMILKVVAGSHAYGTTTPESDTDYRGVCIPPPEYLLGLHEFESRHLQSTDEAVYSLRKFVALALRNNPNILDVLFVGADKVVFMNDYGRDLRSLAPDFVSKRVFKTYGHYAKAQLEAMVKSEGKGSHGVRAEVIEKHGYDTKNALHLVRLLEMGCEILETGEARVLRPNAGELIAIRRGAYSIDEILRKASVLEERLNDAYEHTNLPEEPDTAKIEAWLVDIHRRSLDWPGEEH